MKYVFHPEAEAEFNAAIDYYEKNDIRRCQTQRFPYGVLYVYSENVIFILAVMHLHRDPAYWHDRVQRDLP